MQQKKTHLVKESEKVKNKGFEEEEETLTSHESATMGNIGGAEGFTPQARTPCIITTAGQLWKYLSVV